MPEAQYSYILQSALVLHVVANDSSSTPSMLFILDGSLLLSLVDALQADKNPKAITVNTRADVLWKLLFMMKLLFLVELRQIILCELNIEIAQNVPYPFCSQFIVRSPCEGSDGQARNRWLSHRIFTTEPIGVTTRQKTLWDQLCTGKYVLRQGSWRQTASVYGENFGWNRWLCRKRTGESTCLEKP
jgi:hypothetical protein